VIAGPLDIRVFNRLLENWSVRLKKIGGE